jgi:hypothetical protein
MAANLEDQLIDKVRALPRNKQQEALRLLDSLVIGVVLNLTERAWIADPFGRLLKRSTPGYPQTRGRTYPPTARSILIITSTERRSSSRDSRIC